MLAPSVLSQLDARRSVREGRIRGICHSEATQVGRQIDNFAFYCSERKETSDDLCQETQFKPLTIKVDPTIAEATVHESWHNVSTRDHREVRDENMCGEMETRPC